jgi:hypothetical protein
MSFVNHYRPPPAPPPSDPYGPDPWDINFCLPVDIAALENEVVKLTPLVPRLHLEAIWEAGAGDPDLYRFIRQGFATREDLLGFLTSSQADPSKVTFLIVDKTKPSTHGLGGAAAGMLSYMTTSAANKVRALLGRRRQPQRSPPSSRRRSAS